MTATIEDSYRKQVVIKGLNRPGAVPPSQRRKSILGKMKSFLSSERTSSSSPSSQSKAVHPAEVKKKTFKYRQADPNVFMIGLGTLNEEIELATGVTNPIII